MLDSLQDKDPIHAQVEEIRKAGEHAAELTQQLLAFSRKQVIQPRVVDLNRQVRDLEGMLRRLLGENIQLATDLQEPLHRIKSDPGQLEQVLINLVVNASDAMPSGGNLTIKTLNGNLDEDPSRGSSAGPYVGLIVEDTEIGMDRNVASRVFEPFYTTKETGKGTGMGLSTVYGIVKQNKGRIWLDSTPGEGTTVSVFFPESTEPLTLEEEDGVPVKPCRSARAWTGASIFW